jgi:hypothetical protein
VVALSSCSSPVQRSSACSAKDISFSYEAGGSVMLCPSSRMKEWVNGDNGDGRELSTICGL